MPGKRGRPALIATEVRVFIHLRLRAGEDDDLIAFFACVPPRQRASSLKLALRSGGMQATVSAASADDDLGDALDGLVF
ncbi:MAG TPA: hypothetical protein PKG95_03955 [Anaerolineaceae bacterium]|nr:hypothetical protein [Anaerolineaceae bacterium]